jgi:hypothetical protein
MASRLRPMRVCAQVRVAVAGSHAHRTLLRYRHVRVRGASPPLPGASLPCRCCNRVD